MIEDKENAEGHHSSGSSHARSPVVGRFSVYVHAVLLVSATVAVFLSGRPQQGALGIFLAGAGLVMVLCPPQVKVGWAFWAVGACLVLCGSLAFLPEHWFGVPAWRKGLEAAPAIHLPSSVTPVPWATGFYLAILALSFVIGLFVLAHPIRSRSLLLFAAAASVICAAYAALSMYASETGWQFPYSGGASFGFFLNRNHTAAFLVTGSIVAMGVVTGTFRERRWALALVSSASLTVCLVALLFFSGSRGGVVFLLAGGLIWVAGLGREYRNARLLISVVTILAAAMALFLVSGSEVRNRLLTSIRHAVPGESTGSDAQPPEHSANTTPAKDSEGTTFEGRILIYRDALDVIRDFPLTGIGLGAFTADFAQYRKASLSESLPIHPESDWMMLADEAGIPALVCFVGICSLLLRRLPALRAYPFWPVRWGCIAAAAAGVLHGFVDVPSHRIALGWWILLLAGLGFQASRGGSNGRSRLQHFLFILAGLGSLGLGTQLIRAEWFGAEALPPFQAAKAQAEILATFQRSDIEGAMNMAHAAVIKWPTADPLYYQLGVLLLHFQDTDAEIDQAFEAQRLLNPTWPDVSFEQGEAWIFVDAKRGIALWEDGLERSLRIARAEKLNGDVGASYFKRILGVAAKSQDSLRALAPFAHREPLFTLAWLDAAPPEMARDQLAAFASDRGLMEKFSEAQRQQFFLVWYTKGVPADVARFLSENPTWQPADWPVHLRELADGKHFEQAVREAAEHYQISLALPEVQLPGAPSPEAEPDGDSVVMFGKYWREGNTIAARRVLEDAVASGKDGSTLAPEYWRLRAALSAQDGDWPKAWEYLRTNLRQTQGAGIFP